MFRSWSRPVLGVVAAIAITSTMDATGLFAFSALALLPLFALFWYLDRLSRAEIGFTWGRPLGYWLALLYPVLVLGSIAATAWLAGAIDLGQVNWSKSAFNFALVALMTTLVVIVTEEGFFRGWLWGTLNRRGLNPGWILVATSVAFALWHVSAVVVETDFKPPPSQAPIFLANAALLGAIFGMLRLVSGSVVVSSVAHGVWNGGAYVLFGFGSKVGALGIRDTAFYGPEVGILGLLLNLLFAAAFWQACKPFHHKVR